MIRFRQKAGRKWQNCLLVFCGITLFVDSPFIPREPFLLGWMGAALPLTRVSHAHVSSRTRMLSRIGGCFMEIPVPVAGIDVSKRFSDLCVLSPQNDVLLRQKIYHDITSMKLAEEKLHGIESQCCTGSRFCGRRRYPRAPCAACGC